MRDIGLPNGLAAVGYGAADVDDLVEGSLKQQRLLATAPREVTGEDLAGIFRRVDGTVVNDVAAALRRAGVTDVDDSTLARALYSSDASIYRVVPQVVVRPRSTDEIPAVLEVARASGVPVTMRGAGTSIAGNAVGPGIVVDTSRHLNRVLSVDPDARTATVQPGVVHAALQRAAAPHGLRFGPDPSTHTRCTIGGMIGNNACGSRALGYGRTSDNVEDLSVVLGTGETMPSRRNFDDSRKMRRRRGRSSTSWWTGTWRTSGPSFGQFSRQVSGYAMEHLLPENGRRFDRFLVGSEGTLGIVLEATMRLVEDAPARALAVLGYPSMVEAADAVPGCCLDRLDRRGLDVACEGLDSRIVDVVRAQRGSVPDLPRGAGWLFAEVTAATRAEAESLASAVLGDAGAVDGRVVADPAEMAALWRIREDGAGLAARSPDPAGVLRLGGRRGPAGAARRLPPRVRRPAASSTAWTVCPTGTSATAACTFGSTSSSRTGAAGSASSCSTRLGWSRRTAVRCPASTATAGPGPSCCR